MKNFREITEEELRVAEIVIFDIDGVIVPVGTKLEENQDGTELYMKSNPLNPEFIETLKELKQFVKIGFSSGRNILYLKSLVNEIFDRRVILQAENGNIAWLENHITHPRYTDDYFMKLRDLKERIKEMMKSDDRIRGFEPKLFILTVHCDQMEEIPQLVKKVAGDDFYCLWTNEGYDIGSKDVSKGKAILKLAEYFKIDPKQIIASGNNYNDQEMIEIAKGVTVSPERVQAEYFLEGAEGKLGGELLAELLLRCYLGK